MSATDESLAKDFGVGFGGERGWIINDVVVRSIKLVSTSGRSLL